MNKHKKFWACIGIGTLGALAIPTLAAPHVAKLMDRHPPKLTQPARPAPKTTAKPLAKKPLPAKPTPHAKAPTVKTKAPVRAPAHKPVAKTAAKTKPSVSARKKPH
jgi:hypothetical protein